MSEEFGQAILGAAPRLRAYAISLLRSSSEADDLVQEVLVRAWRFRDTFQPGTNLIAWLFRILRNEFINQNKRRPREVSLDETFRGSEFSRGPGQEWNLQLNDLLAALDTLPELSRQAIMLVAVCGFSYDEAAAVCDCAPGTIKSRVSRARQHLAAVIDPDSSETPLKSRHGGACFEHAAL